MLFDTTNGVFVREITYYNHQTGVVLYLSPNVIPVKCSIHSLKSTWEETGIDLRKALHNRPCVELIHYPPRVWRSKRNRKDNSKRVRNYVQLIRDAYRPYDWNAEAENRSQWL